MQMEDRLPRAAAHVDEDVVILETFVPRRLGDEREHSFRLLLRKLIDVTERLDVPLGNDEQMHVGLRVDVADRHEARALTHVVALAVEPAKEAVIRQR
jgi:hypothetical protein